MAGLNKGGNYTSGTLTTNSVVLIGTQSSGYMPDVCLSSQSNDRVTYCYLESNMLYVESDSYVNLSGGTSTPSNLQTFGGTYTLLMPRIACPNPTLVGNLVDWTVVVDDSDGTTAWEIAGHTFNSINGLTNSVYNTGGFGLIDISGDANYMPVVTYDDQNNIFVGWNFDNRNNSAPTTDALYPIVLVCDNDGAATAGRYWDVPTILATGEVKDILSISGKNASDQCLYTYYDFGNSDINYKSVLGAVAMGSLRSNLSQHSVNTNALDYFNNNKNITILGRIIDKTGKILVEKQTSYGEFDVEIYKLLKKYASSIYIVEIHTPNFEYSIRRKIFTN